MSGASRAGRALLKAGSRALPTGRRGGRWKAARGLASSVTVNTWEHHHQGLAVVGAVAAAASVSLAVLSEAETLEDVLPSFLLERLLREEERPLRRIQDFYTVDKSQTLGHGQFGTVAKATDNVTGEVVAVKCVPRSMASEAHFREEAGVHREAANHPNVVGFKGVFADEDCWYMVMQLAEGGELYDRLTTEGFVLDDGEVRSLLRDTADALEFLHDRSIVHGDVKPENMLLAGPVPPAPPAAAVQQAREGVEGGEGIGIKAGGGEEAGGAASGGGGVGKVMLADFGSSFRTGDGSGMKTVKEYTVAYSAPEVVANSPEISTATDIWSLGVIAYVLIKGYHPFDPTSDADDEEIADSILHSEPDWDLEMEGVEPRAASLIRRMLSRDPEDRPSAREVLQNSWLQQ